MKKALALGVAGGVSLLALAMAAPGESVAKRGEVARAAVAAPSRAIGTFTPAVRDPRLAAELARRSESAASEQTAFQFTPATTEADRSQAVRVAVRVRPGILIPGRARPAVPGATAAVETPSGMAIEPSTYNLGVAVGWRRFAVTGEASSTSGGPVEGSRETNRIGVDYRATPRLTARVQVAAEKAEGAQRVVSDDRALALDVAGSYSIARNIDVTGGVRYRVSRDRIEPLARDERRDSQAVYIGTAVRF
ncbi:MAG TPA: hypothetical protein VEZ41_04025 [Allosphingosinicella sp.]|nr:hypothetical protein [Allosphingosinicella sp.]